MVKRRGKRKSTSRAAHHRHAPQKPAHTPATTPTPVLLTGAIVLAGLGMLLTAYLTWQRWTAGPLVFCEAGSGCDLVQESRWSMLLGLPLSLWGFAMYALLAALLWYQRRRPSLWKRTLTVAALGTGFSIYLTTVSIFVIEATCPYCLTSFAIITAILILLVLLRPVHQPFDPGRWAIGTGGALLLLIGGLHMHYSGVFDPAAGPEKPFLQALAEHLDSSGAAFYGAYWCPVCLEQKELFEASADRLPYVECSPAGRGGPVANACVDKQISRYPTWIIDGKRHQGALSPQTLAKLSAYRGAIPR